MPEVFRRRDSVGCLFISRVGGVEGSPSRHYLWRRRLGSRSISHVGLVTHNCPRRFSCPSICRVAGALTLTAAVVGSDPRGIPSDHRSLGIPSEPRGTQAKCEFFPSEPRGTQAKWCPLRQRHRPLRYSVRGHHRKASGVLEGGFCRHCRVRQGEFRSPFGYKVPVPQPFFGQSRRRLEGLMFGGLLYCAFGSRSNCRVVGRPCRHCLRCRFGFVFICPVAGLARGRRRFTYGRRLASSRWLAR